MAPVDTESRPSGRWLPFAAGVILGCALSALAVAAALSQQRRARRSLPWSRRRAGRSASESYPRDDAASMPHESAGTRAARSWPEDAALDRELEQTFPASDPLPFSHRVD